eukprot:TRINITY_DN768_c0_g1_i2.p1 TRINITY_DN768_c0_g1~~TRINITY_DN768_c0_g1_i2.p1  ORF type:complete len:453 (-),score=85.32 TRINITY_DN768_c0_g1_i2:61-1419(-)
MNIGILEDEDICAYNSQMYMSLPSLQPLNGIYQTQDHESLSNLNHVDDSSMNVGSNYDVSIMVNQFIENYQALSQQEEHFLQRLVQTVLMDPSQMSESDLRSQVEKALSGKMINLKNLSDRIMMSKIENIDNDLIDNIEDKTYITVKIQPPKQVAMNVNIDPPIFAVVDDYIISQKKENTFHVQVMLIRKDTNGNFYDTEVFLEGDTMVPVEAGGSVIFNNLRVIGIEDFSSEYIFRFHLVEYLPNNMSIFRGAPVFSTSLKVNVPTKKRKRENDNVKTVKKRPRGRSKSRYVDITELLVLPQKQAAFQLGISESMLCKRFKESTRRKWPYRYLRKLDKMIGHLTLNKDLDQMPMEDKDQLLQLQQQKQDCLTPVIIRVTGDAAKNFPETDFVPTSPTTSETMVTENPIPMDTRKLSVNDVGGLDMIDSNMPILHDEHDVATTLHLLSNSLF